MYTFDYDKEIQDIIALTKEWEEKKGRAIYNPFIERVLSNRVPVKTCYSRLEHRNPREIPYCITEELINAAKGDVENSLLFCGANTYQKNEIRSVKK